MIGEFEVERDALLQALDYSPAEEPAEERVVGVAPERVSEAG